MHADSARSSVLDTTVTFAFSRASNSAARSPTGPVAPSTIALQPARFKCLRELAIAAAAVVLHPFESIITDTRIGPKNVFDTIRSSNSPLATSLPPMNIAEFFNSAGPRVNINPWTRPVTFPGVTEPYEKSCSTFESTATTWSKLLGSASVSNCARMVFN